MEIVTLVAEALFAVAINLIVYTQEYPSLASLSVDAISTASLSFKVIVLWSLGMSIDVRKKLTWCMYSESSIAGLEGREVVR